MDISQEPFRASILSKHAEARSPGANFVRACGIEMHMVEHENSRPKCHGQDGSQDRDPHFVRACAIDMRMEISQDNFLLQNLQQKCPKSPRRPCQSSILAPTPRVRVRPLAGGVASQQAQLMERITWLYTNNWFPLLFAGPQDEGAEQDGGHGHQAPRRGSHTGYVG
jgi:hypothetical protein